MVQKAYDAFNSAKGRCNNPKNKSYPKYGGAGIKFLLPSFDAMLNEIGLPKPKQSLDRKDAYGHYELGNIRWTNTHVQAANKMGLTGGWVQSDDAIVLHVASQQQLKAERRSASDSWVTMVRAINRGRFNPADRELLMYNKLPLAVLDAGWDLGQTRDLAEPPSYFHLPSLTVPGSAVRLDGGVFDPSLGHVMDDGIRGFGRHQPSGVIDAAIFKQLPPGFLSGKSLGAMFVGASHAQFLSRGGLEGLFLVLASFIRFGPPNTTASMLPMLTAMDRLAECGPSYTWDDASNKAAVLDAKYLFIPDVHIGSGGKEQLSTPLWGAFVKLIQYRAKRNRRTYVGIHHLGGIPAFAVSELLAIMDKVGMPQLLQVGPLNTYKAQAPRSPNCFGFASMLAALEKP